jgi:hypothetical protein
MKVKTFLIIKAVVSLFFGVALALLPAALMSLYGVTLDPAGTLMGRLIGACLIGIGLICWLGRDYEDDARRGVTLALFIGDTVGFIVSLVGQLSGQMNTLGWMVVVIWFLLALGNGYSRFVRLSG